MENFGVVTILKQMSEITNHQQDLIERFEAIFNRIHGELRKGTDRPDGGFIAVLNEYGNKRKWWPHKTELARIADLRNIIVHDKFKPYEYIAVPTDTVIARLEHIEKSSVSPRTACSEFRRAEVIRVKLNETVDDVLKKVYHLDFSQFPVYDGERFVGLLTENGITRWLADYAQNHDSILLFTDATVQNVLEKEERRSNFKFVPRTMTIDEVIYAFKNRQDLEAVLVTANGQEHEKLLGIGTRWDITSYLA